MKCPEIWLDVENFLKFEQTKEYKKILEMKKQIKLLEEQSHKLTIEALKKYNIKYSEIK